jgi:hypothetical protein
MTCQIKKILKISSIVFGIIFLFSSTLSSSKAQTSISPLIVAPARQSLTGDPGQKVNFAVRFYNTATESVPGVFKVADFIVNDNLGTPSFLEGPTVLSDRFSAAKWISLSAEKGTISSDGMITVAGTVKIPNNASPGGKYFAVFFEPDTNVPGANGEKQQEAAAVTMRIAGLVYLRVSGPISEGASITKFTSPGFSEYGPISITSEIKNNGDYHISPEGQIVIKDIFGQTVATSSLASTNIFPDASRLTTTKVGEKWMLGRFTANLNASYGENNNKVLAASLVFWVFPWKLAIIIVLALAIIILIIAMIFNKFVKKEKKLEEELFKEKTELEKLKENYRDIISTNSSIGSSSGTKTPEA